MPAKKIRVEIFDNEGSKYTMILEGSITRNKVLKILDLAELLGGLSMNINNHETIPNQYYSKFDKVKIIVKERFPLIWFTSKEVQMVFEREFKEPISLSTISTYLSRMTNRGLLQKTKISNYLKYKNVLMPKISSV
jgi:hypothetical protein